MSYRISVGFALVALTLLSVGNLPAMAEPPTPGEQRNFDGIDFVWIPAGSFWMGSPEDEIGRSLREGPVHEVRFDSGFWMSKYEITVEQYMRFVRATDSHHPKWDDPGSDFNIHTGSLPYYRKQGDSITEAKYPIVGVTWHDAVAFAHWLGEQSGHEYRLPSEAEWEYAARAGTTTRYSFGDDPAQLCEYANGVDRSSPNPNWRNSLCEDDWPLSAAPVGSFKPNPFGLYDMHGNVRELVDDCYHQDYLGAPNDGRVWREEDDGDCSQRIWRGGSWNDTPILLRSANRFMSSVNSHNDDLGFRLVMDQPENSSR